MTAQGVKPKQQVDVDAYATVAFPAVDRPVSLGAFSARTSPTPLASFKHPATYGLSPEHSLHKSAPHLAAMSLGKPVSSEFHASKSEQGCFLCVDSLPSKLSA